MNFFKKKFFTLELDHRWAICSMAEGFHQVLGLMSPCAPPPVRAVRPACSLTSTWDLRLQSHSEVTPAPHADGALRPKLRVFKVGPGCGFWSSLLYVVLRHEDDVRATRSCVVVTAVTPPHSEREPPTSHQAAAWVKITQALRNARRVRDSGAGLGGLQWPVHTRPPHHHGRRIGALPSAALWGGHSCVDAKACWLIADQRGELWQQGRPAVITWHV